MAKINFDISKRLDITVKRGDSFKLELTLKDSSGNPLNLHGDTFHFAVATASGSIRLGTNTVVPPPTIITDQILTDDESTTAETATGKVRFEASAADLKYNLPAGTHRYDIQYVDASDTIDSEGNARTILFGSFIVKDDFSIHAE